ncbi:MAG: hypothetical protein HXY34_06475 [Candidatus Thorarchaeota archaeon]|nr:hypothetical protein [Candidatus Thorarchaeota archaeon]
MSEHEFAEGPQGKRPRSILTRRVRQKLKQYVTVFLFMAWIGFVSVWLLMLAQDHDLIQNIAVVVSSFIMMCGLVGMMWASTDSSAERHAWRISVSILFGTGWLAFIVLWPAFYAGSYTLYQNVALLIVATVTALLANMLAWGSTASRDMQGGVRQVGATAVVFIGWCLFIAYWLWFEPVDLIWERDVAVGIMSMIAGVLVLAAIWLPYGRRHGEINGLWVIALFLAWLALLCVWFWFFAEPLNLYQNTAVTLISLVITGVIAALVGRSREFNIRDLSFD